MDSGRPDHEDSRARLAAIIDSSHDAIVSKSLDSTIMTWNAAAERIFGYTASEAIGRSMTLIIPEDRLAEETMVLTKIRAGEVVDHFETVRRRKDGQLIPISLTISPIKDLQGKIIGASKIARDITESTRAEQERARLLLDLQRANQAKDEFLAMLGHELRNPLGVLTTAVHVLELEQNPQEAARVRSIIAAQAEHLKHLVDDLLEVGRVVAGKIRLDLQTVDLGAIACAHFDALRAAGKFADHQASCEVASLLVRADPQRLQQILDNLLGNALKFTPPGGTITVRVRKDGGDAVLEVADSGIGMSPELLRSVFDLFVQGHRLPDRAEGGLGLGLTLVRQLVELHRGSVEALSPGLGEGSCLVVRMPLSTAGIAVGTPPPTAPTRLSPQRIVIVEDNTDGREMLRQLLEFVGHQVEEAADGPTGVEKILGWRPTVALVDIGLPGFDGYEVARRVRAAEHDGPRPLLIALTGYGLEGDRKAARAAGFDHHLTKPVSPKDLARVFHEHQQKRADPG
ncbi:hybrid sensor histidine kinase/response regulator [Nannocystis radixulma]|uniref:histidine kinase n=1 Tax=Nannocystis radixulma TaxID=2995305 RepID=A0ABT5B2S6_9BACT|nr:PAS domain S-box protein [Nannocystis radixulma]MDC0668419.1 PAS domain S-box protein [Nannocystis radixulma]